MKRCPTCGNTYTNDELIFCLEDGATLLSVRDSQPSFNPEATLRISAEENALPPPEAAKPQGAPTHRQSAPPLTVPPRQPPATSDHQAPAASTSRSTSPVIVAGITAIVVLLLVVAGIGIALLVRNTSSSGDASNAENGNRAVNREPGRNASNTVNDNGSTSPSDSSNKASVNGANRNVSTATDSVGRAESKVVRGAQLGESDLSALSREELRRLRNAVYARHGRTFDSADLQRYFESRSWYKPRSDYTETELTETDRANIKLIQSVENSR
ncbi:MAG TPA: YARHG domain-containing protein [Pyrinomonadaceae bacterium]|jgi:hypothetical protein